MSDVLTKEIFLNRELTARDAEVVSAEVLAGQREGVQGFSFKLEKGFLPTLGWLGRLLVLLKPVIQKKQPVGISCHRNQVCSLHVVGIDLIACIKVE